MIAIIDYGLGNPGSILNMLKKQQIPAIITSNKSEINTSNHIIIPGVGAFDKGMGNLKEMGLIDILNEEVLIKKKPTLGICLGMQLMCNNSEEGELPGLGWVSAQVKKFRFIDNSKRIPHFGWEEININKKSDLFFQLEKDARFYFVHSFHVNLENNDYKTASCDYGYSFSAAFQKDNIFGVQFHPEKSHKFGFQLLRNFVNIK